MIMFEANIVCLGFVQNNVATAEPPIQTLMGPRESARNREVS